MNNMEQLLRDTIGPALDDYISIGARLYENIDNNRRVCIRFSQGNIYDKYDGITMSVIDKNDGVIDRQTLPFAELFDDLHDLTHPNRLDKHIWKNNGEYKWYGKPTAGDIKALRDAVRNYISVWE